MFDSQFFVHLVEYFFELPKQILIPCECFDKVFTLLLRMLLSEMVIHILYSKYEHLLLSRGETPEHIIDCGGLWAEQLLFYLDI